MKRICCLITMITAALACPAWAHDETEELGHHWADAVYTHEIRLQIVAMAVAVFVLLLGSMIVRRLKSGRTTQ
ncbi:MAG: hypothetical protein ABFD54_15355 [Armatimonadota bacterium]|nr:hypothetical protein [bacterium]